MEEEKLFKRSNDLINWKKIDMDKVKIEDNGKKVILTFKANSDYTYISAQEILSSAWYDSWYEIRNHIKTSKEL